jgi:hypothetical protein
MAEMMPLAQAAALAEEAVALMMRVLGKDRLQVPELMYLWHSAQ